MDGQRERWWNKTSYHCCGVQFTGLEKQENNHPFHPPVIPGLVLACSQVCPSISLFFNSLQPSILLLHRCFPSIPGSFCAFLSPFLPASGLLGDQSSWRTLIRGNRTAMFTLICVPAKRKRQFNIAVSTLVEQMQGNEMQRQQEVATCWEKVRAQWSCTVKQTSLTQRDYSLCRECNETSNTWFWIEDMLLPLHIFL